MTEDIVIKVQTEGLSYISLQVCGENRARVLMRIADLLNPEKSISVLLNRNQINELAIELLILKKRLQESGVS